MFGMLDYRAHKLYRILVFPVAYFLGLLTLFVPATAAYIFGLWITKDAFLLPITVMVAWFIAGIPWMLLVKLALAVPNAIFNFLIDPVPADGRTKEEALAVVMGGEKAILALKFNKPALDWSDDDIEALSKITLSSRFFQDEIQHRIFRVRNYYCENPHIAPSEYQTNKLLKEWKVAPTWNELIVTNAYYRSLLIQFVVLLLIVFYAPR